MIIPNLVRSGVKTVTWRVIATATTMLIVYFYTGEFNLMIGVGFYDVILKLVIYFLHERVWISIRYGRDLVDRELTIALSGLVNFEDT
jgi:adenylylsulfate kinase